MNFKGNILNYNINNFLTLTNENKDYYCSICLKNVKWYLCDYCNLEKICFYCKQKYKINNEQCFLLKEFYKNEFLVNDSIFIIFLKYMSRIITRSKLDFNPKTIYDIIPNKYIENTYSILVEKFIDFLKNNYENLEINYIFNKSYLLCILQIIFKNRILLFDSILKTKVIGFLFNLNFYKYKHSCNPDLEIIFKKKLLYLVLRKDVKNTKNLTINKLNLNLNYYPRQTLYKKLFFKKCKCNYCEIEYNNYLNYYKNQLFQEKTLVKSFEKNLLKLSDLSYNFSFIKELNTNGEFIFYLKKLNYFIKNKDNEMHKKLLFNLLNNFLNYLNQKNDSYFYFLIVNLMIDILKGKKIDKDIKINKIIIWNLKIIKFN